MRIEGVVSCDSHLVEPREGLPEGARWDGEGGVLLTLGEGYDCPTLPVWPAVSNGKPMEPVRSLDRQPAAFDPQARRHWQVQHGVAAEILYPTFAAVAVETAINYEARWQAANRYNAWVMERFGPPHFWPLYLSSMLTPPDCAEDIRVAHHLGSLGVVLPTDHGDGAGTGQLKDYEEAFAEAERLGLPVHWHAFSRPTPGSFGRHPLQVAWEAFRPAQDILVELLCEGILARHPGLRVVFAESDCSWVAHATWRMARYADRYGQLVGFEGSGRLFDIVQRQVTFVSQSVGEIVEEEHTQALWGCDFPHADATTVGAVGDFKKVFNERAVRVYPRVGEALSI